jgi:hypothetical protein
VADPAPGVGRVVEPIREPDSDGFVGPVGVVRFADGTDHAFLDEGQAACVVCRACSVCGASVADTQHEPHGRQR